MAVYTSKKDLEQVLKEQLRTQPKVALKALERLYENQTADERASKSTRYYNEVGFSGVDSTFLSSLAEQYLSRGRLSENQMRYLHKLLPKYAGQLVRNSISSGKIIYAHKRYFTTEQDFYAYESSMEMEKEMEFERKWENKFVEAEQFCFSGFNQEVVNG